MNVLLVEDEAALADVFVRNLRARSHEVTVAATAEDAVRLLADQRHDVLILDVNLPDQTGWDVLRRLSAAQRMLLRVIVISAAPISRKRIEEFRADVALQKPFPIDALVRALTGEPAPAVAYVGDS